MKKNVIALMVAAFMAVSPMGAKAEETDFSYLEDMSIKEVKALKEAINDLLAGEEVTEDIDIVDLEEMSIKELKALRDAIDDMLGQNSVKEESKEESSDVNLDEWNDENLAALSWLLLESTLKDPYSLEINEILVGTNGYENGFGIMENVPSVKITCHANNSYGFPVIGEYYSMVWSYKEDMSSTFPVLYNDVIPNGEYLVLGTDYDGFDGYFVKTKKLNIAQVKSYVDAYKKAGDGKIWGSRKTSGYSQEPVMGRYYKIRDYLHLNKEENYLEFEPYDQTYLYGSFKDVFLPSLIEDDGDYMIDGDVLGAIGDEIAEYQIVGPYLVNHEYDFDGVIPDTDLFDVTIKRSLEINGQSIDSNIDFDEDGSYKYLDGGTQHYGKYERQGDIIILHDNYKDPISGVVLNGIFNQYK